jgi:hypothetical protein
MEINHKKWGDQHVLLGEKGKELSRFHQMGPLEYLDPMHAVFLNIPKCFLRVQMHVHDVIKLMEVEKDLKHSGRSLGN